MSKLSAEQKNYIKTFDSKKSRKKLKKSFKESNKETEVTNSIKVLRKFFKSIDPNK